MSEINYSASTPKKSYTRRIGDNGFLGADFSTAPIFASDRRFRDLKNVWKDYKSGSGVAIETVPGYRLIDNYDPDTEGVSPAIHGIHKFSLSSAFDSRSIPSQLDKSVAGTWYIVHCGTELFCVSEFDWTSSYTITIVKSNGVVIPDKPSVSIQGNDALILLSDNKMFYITPNFINGLSFIDPDTFEAFDVDEVNPNYTMAYGQNPQYVPTTYINGLPYEQKNMLTVRSKEKYTGVSTLSEQITDGNTTTTVYYVSVRLHEKVPEGSSPYKSNIVSVKLDGTAVDKTNVMVTRSGGYIAHIRVDTSDHTSGGTHTVDVEYASDPAKFTSYRDFEDYKDKSTFNEGNPDYSGTAYAAIAGCTICATFDERVFLSGNPNLPNTVFYSQRDLTGYNNPTYFGVLNYNNLGTSNAPITAMIPSANALYVLKDDSATDPTMYVLSGLSTEKDLIPRIYTVESGLPGIGCKGAACNFLDDIVFMSRNGVIGIDKQAVNLERTLGDRSVLINGKLLLEDVTQAVFAEAEGYLWVLFKNNGHVYLADSRAYTQGAGYEWYFIDSVGSWTGDADFYTYSNAYLNGAQSADLEDKSSASARAETEEGGEITNYSPGTKYKVVARTTENDQANPASKVTVYFEYTEERTWNDRHDDYDVAFTANTDGAFVVIVPTGETVDGVATYYQIVPTGEKINGTFHPATCMVASNDRIFFGTDNGDLLTFNNDKRGVQAESEIAVRAEDNTIDGTDIYEANRYPFLLRPEWYSFCGHRIESFVETSDDDGGIGNVTKDTVRRSTVVDMKAMLGSSWTITVYTDRDNGQPATVATGAMDDATQTTFEGVNFNGGDHVITQIRERSRKWVHKRYRVESNGFRCPFGLYRITYNFEINGRIK